MSAITGQVYTERKMVVGVFLGGPIAGAYLFRRTFTTLGMTTAGMYAPILAALILIVTLGSSFIPPFDRIPNVVFWGAQIGLTYGVYRAYLTGSVEKFLAEGNLEYGWGNTLAISVGSFLLTIGIILAILFFTGAFNGPSIKSFGTLKHEIAYDEKNITADEVDSIGAALTSAGFFDQEMRKTIDAAKDGDRFILNLYFIETANDPEFIEMVRGLRQDVQRSLPNNPIVVDMVVGAPGNRIARLE